MKLANRISLVFFFFSLVFGGVILCPVYFLIKNHLATSIAANMESLVSARAEHVETYFKMLDLSIAQLAKSVVLEELLKSDSKEDPDWQRKYSFAARRLKNTLKVGTSLAQFDLLDNSGRVVVSTRDKEVGQDKSRDPFFFNSDENIRINEKLFFSEDQALVMSIAVPVRNSDTGAFLGEILTYVKMDEINRIITDRHGLGEEGEMYIVNRYGYMVTPSRFHKDVVLKKKISSRNISNAFLSSAKVLFVSDRTLGETYLNYRGKKVLGSNAYISRMHWAVIAEMAAAEAFAPLNVLQTFFYWSLALAAFIAMGLGILVARFITDPLVKLNKGAEIIGRGNLEHKIGLKTNDEIGQLARAFDKMAGNLKATMVSAEISNKYLRERQQAERDLLESEKKFMDGIYASEDAIILISDNACVDGNAAAIRMLGYSGRSEFMMKHPAELAPPMQPDGQISRNKFDKMMAIALHRGFHRFEYLFCNANGENFPAQVSLTQVLMLGASVLHAVVNDLTLQKQQEHRLLQARMDLKRQSVRLDASLKEALQSREILTSMLDDNYQIRLNLENSLEELKRSQNMLIHSEKLASLGRMVSEIAHEVNNPLMIISGNAQLALMEEPKSDEEKKTLEIITHECQRAKEVIRRVLRFARPSKGEIKEININQTIDAVVNIVEKQFLLTSNVEIKREYSPDAIFIGADEQQLQEVYMNLLNNARESMLQGGVITITTLLQGDQVRIVFKDNGPGMTEEVLQKIMEPFFTTKETGTGIGLAVCYGIVKAHSGELVYESAVGKGTTAIILLPLKGAV